MKKQVKVAGLVLLFSICAFFVQAQTGKPAWQTSKDVQKIANKSLFSDENLKASHVNATSVGHPAVVSSKGITRISNPGSVQTETKGNVVSKGYPMWTVSKGVQRVSRR
jgi:hypothetical protein